MGEGLKGEGGWGEEEVGVGRRKGGGREGGGRREEGGSRWQLESDVIRRRGTAAKQTEAKQMYTLPFFFSFLFFSFCVQVGGGHSSGALQPVPATHNTHTTMQLRQRTPRFRGHQRHLKVK